MSDKGKQSSSDWPKEAIPDSAVLYMRAHKSYIVSGELQPGVFQDKGDGMSTNWQKYCLTPSEAREKARVPSDNGIVSLVASETRAIPLAVEHTPNPVLADRSHTDVIGKKTSAVRIQLLKIFTWEIQLSAHT